MAETAGQLVGQLSTDGLATLHPEKSAKNGEDAGTVHADPPPAYSPSKESLSSDDEALETYESHALDPDTLVNGSAGGQAVSTPAALPRVRPQMWSRRESIPIRLEKTQKKGRYMLTLDDPETREIIQRSLERKQDTADGRIRSGFKDLVFTRRFTTFDRQNPTNADSPYLGFFVLFWLVMGFLFVKVAAQNYHNYGSVLGSNELLRMMFGREVISLAVTDSVICLATASGLGLQLLVYRGWLRWNGSGWITVYLGAVIGWTFYRDWPWTHTIFIALHMFVFIMKQHSYAFYNGYLSEVYKRRSRLQRKLKQLQEMSPVNSPQPTPLSESFPAIIERSSSLRHRRNVSLPKTVVVPNLSKEPEEISTIATAISSGQELDSDQLEAFSDIISDEIAALDKELKGKCTITDNHYPNNLTLYNWAEWTCLPTLVYELEYPRQEKINWAYVAEKTTAVFGVLTIMQVISQAYIYPPIKEAVRMKEHTTLEERWQEFPFLLLDMMLPLLLEQLLTWYLIWECVLNVIAEVTCFADRGFYGPWWNSLSMDQYARDWNRPVHNFLLRHVYHSSISSFHLSKTGATFATFFLSALVHELLMFLLFKKVRGYLFFSQLTQIPMAMLSRTKLLKGKNVLGMILFWVGMFIGPAFLTSLYLVI